MAVVTNSPIMTGTFTSAGTPVTLPFQPVISRLDVIDLTAYNAAVAFAGQQFYRGLYNLGMSSGFASRTRNTAATFNLVEDVIQTNGFTLFDTVSPVTFAPAALAAVASISIASPAVVTSAAAHGLVTGDIVRITSVNPLDVLNGLLFVVTVTGAATFTIPVSTIGQAVVGAGGFFRKVIPPIEWQPEAKIVTAISVAAAAVVTTSIPHGYVPGAIVRLLVPANFGMTRANGLLATITATPTANTFTTNVNSTGFTAFAFPQQAPAFASSYAQSVPVGEIASSFLSASANLATRGIILGTSVVGTAGDSMRWIAYSGLTL